MVGNGMECGGKRSATPLWMNPGTRSPPRARTVTRSGVYSYLPSDTGNDLPRPVP